MVDESNTSGKQEPPIHLCISCGERGAYETIGFCHLFCETCWRKMTPFERGLLNVVETGYRLEEILEKELHSAAGLIAASLEGGR